VGYYGGYYAPYYAWGYPWAWGWGWGYPWFAYPPAYYGYTNSTSSVRLQVTPREAEVYVDGSLAGIVDEFDGTFQRLHLPPGEHEIEVYLQGYQSVKQRILLQPFSTYKIKFAMAPLGAGEQQPPRPVPVQPPPQTTQAPPSPQPWPPAEGQRGAPVERGSVQVQPYGTLSIRVQPPDAVVLIDGEAWQAPSGSERLTVEVRAGLHTVEVRRDGHQPYVANIDVRPGEVRLLNVSLLGQPD
jgi:hypothetical protein